MNLQKSSKWKESSNSDVNDLLAIFAEKNIEHYEIVQALREMLFQVYPKVKERKMYGGIMFSIDEDFAGLFVYKEHVTMEFGNGYLFEDPSEILDGTGKQRRNLKFKTLKDIETNKTKGFIKQAVSS